MRISDILRRKGDLVVMISPDDSVRHLLDLLAEHRVGALVVASGPESLDGIVSERDVVRRLQSHGDAILDGPVRDIMTTALHTAAPGDRVDDLMLLMTDKRVRHLPVIVEGRLAGIVSIGDLVNQCISELRSERDQLTAYISS